MREQTPRRPHSSAIKSVTKLPAKHEATKVNSKKYFDQDEEESSSDDNDSEDDEDQADANQIDTYNDQVDSEEDDDDSDDDESNSEFSEEDEPVPVAKPQSKAKGASAVQFDSNVPLYKLLAQSKAASAVVDANAEPTHVRKRPQSKQRVDRSGEQSQNNHCALLTFFYRKRVMILTRRCGSAASMRLWRCGPIDLYDGMPTHLLLIHIAYYAVDCEWTQTTR